MTKNISQKKQVNKKKSTNSVSVKSHLPTEHDKLIIEFGYQFAKNSLDYLVDFNKTMLGLTATFVAIASSFLGIYSASSVITLNFSNTVLLVAALLCMLLSNLCFTFGYIPRKIDIRFQDLNALKQARKKIIKTKKLWGNLGVFFFSLSILLLLSSIVVSNVNIG